MSASATFGARLSLFLCLVSAAALGSAFYLQHVEGLAPCILCIWQRWPYAAGGALALLAFLLIRQHGRARGPDLWAATPLLLSALAFAVGAGIAAFHVGVEQTWWDGLAECSGAGDADTVEGLKAQLLGAPVVRCDEVAWDLYGISLAGYNLLLSLVLAVVSWIGARALWRGGAS